MKKVSIQTNNHNPHFIGSWTLETFSICEDLINYFELNLDKQKKGTTGSGVNPNSKDSIDIRIKPKEIILPGNEAFKAYFEELFECYKNYIEEWPFLKELAQKLEIGSFNLQRYKPGQHFKKIHTERLSIDSSHRVFAFMTYLNDVEEGGSTYFSHYDLEIQPRKGLTLIWPAEWTHAHRGNILRKGSKYIITGWICFAN
ncbi:2OG-Fe(II) oxygenase [Prochlorococcus marinus XMU1403]|uniref:2OG-Fe(II) oxygenase n=1 Tax=Prochlorococcus marinus TaxID=1219 RepID=UPI000D87A59F|nr:2OG-Fe(II) oxygenase [Prochlorococcus marinus]MBW3050155.1 2OG-Fe(II) oxygenase [Prochlorococcus marinus str. MU1403]PYE00348.1 2OG-Fe(II) oxygenase [Prochlorococcus marinus XMU1403]